MRVRDSKLHIDKAIETLYFFSVCSVTSVVKKYFMVRKKRNYKIMSWFFRNYGNKFLIKNFSYKMFSVWKACYSDTKFFHLFIIFRMRKISRCETAMRLCLIFYPNYPKILLFSLFFLS